MEERLFYEVDDLVTYLVLMCDGETTVRESQRVTHQKDLHATVAFVLEVRGVKFLMST